MNRERLLFGLESMGILIEETTIERFSVFHTLLDEANKNMDLTAVLSEDERIDRHYLDSAILLRFALLPEGARVIDVGSGAGFPGMPLLILRPDLRMTFLDAQKKRVRFLSQVLSELSLPGIALHGRAEDIARLPEHRDAYDRALSRAVAASPVLMELTLPFVRPGGLAIAWKGPAAVDEFQQTRRAAFLLGASLRDPLPAPVPGHKEWNHIFLIGDKERATPKAYPRKAGIPARKPLG